jgi:hypothetical protein
MSKDGIDTCQKCSKSALRIAFYRKALGTINAQGSSEFSIQFGRKFFRRTLNGANQCQGAYANPFT